MKDQSEERRYSLKFLNHMSAKKSSDSIRRYMGAIESVAVDEVGSENEKKARFLLPGLKSTHRYVCRARGERSGGVRK